MNIKIAKKISNIQKNRLNNYSIKKARKFINSKIRKSALNGEYSTIIHLGTYLDNFKKTVIEQENYYKEKGFDVELITFENQFYSKQYSIKISWND